MAANITKTKSDLTNLLIEKHTYKATVSKKKKEKSNLNLIKPLDLTPKVRGNTESKVSFKLHHRNAISKIKTLRNPTQLFH